MIVYPNVLTACSTEVSSTKSPRFIKVYKDTYTKLEKDNDKNTCLYEEGLFQAIGFKEFHEFFTNEEDNEEKKKASFE